MLRSSPATSAIRTPSSEPLSFRTDPSGPGGSPRSWRVRLLSRVYLSASESMASWASRCWIPGFSHAGRPSIATCRASAISRAICAVWLRPPAEWRSYMSVVVETFQPLVDRPEQVRLRHGHVGEEDLVEVMVAGHQDERPHGDSRRRHRDEEAADPLVLRRIRARADQQDDPVREVRARRPHLLAVDDEVVALIDGARTEARQIGAGAGLGEALAPDLVGVEDRGEMAALLLLGAPVDESRARQVQAHVAWYDGRAGRSVLLVPDDPLDQSSVAPPVLLGPRDADPA